MHAVMAICTIGNVVQAVLYQRVTGKFQTVFWCLAALTGLLSFV